MSKTTTLGSEIAPASPAMRPARGLLSLRTLLLVVGLVLALVAPLFVEEFWLRTGFGVFGAMIGAIGLNLLVGTTGQLSLAHAFFLAVGASTYVFVAGKSGGTATEVEGLSLPPALGLVLGVLLAGLAGLLFSPIAARLRGIYLGVASLGLVFIGQHLMNVVTPVTGGFNGRITPKFSLFGFEFSGVSIIASPSRFVATRGNDVNASGIFNDDFVDPNQRAIRPEGGWDTWYRTLDVRLAKLLPVPGGNASLSIEVFNVFNTVNWSGYGGAQFNTTGTVALQNYGVGTGAYQPRQLQAGIRYKF